MDTLAGETELLPCTPLEENPTFPQAPLRGSFGAFHLSREHSNMIACYIILTNAPLKTTGGRPLNFWGVPQSPTSFHSFFLSNGTLLFKEESHPFGGDDFSVSLIKRDKCSSFFSSFLEEGIEDWSIFLCTSLACFSF